MVLDIGKGGSIIYLVGVLETRPTPVKIPMTPLMTFSKPVDFPMTPLNSISEYNIRDMHCVDSLYIP